MAKEITEVKPSNCKNNGFENCKDYFKANVSGCKDTCPLWSPKLRKYEVYIAEDNLHLRDIICGCGHEDCRIGLHFDNNDEGEPIIHLVDKFGNWNAMHMNIDNTTLLLDNLNGILKDLNRKKLIKTLAKK